MLTRSKQPRRLPDHAIGEHYPQSAPACHFPIVFPLSPAPNCIMNQRHPPRELAQEHPIGLCIEDVPFAVLMATPQDIEDLAYGFAITEGLAGFDEIADVTTEETPDGWRVNINRRADAQRRLPRARTIESRSGCGVCGTSRLRDAVRSLPTVQTGLTVTRAAIMRALAGLEAGQVLGARTRATHAAGFADSTGQVMLVREDVGRHNALDKLVGAAARAGIDATRGFVLITSRCSFEMVEKTVRMGAPLLVAVSAPTSLAIERAQLAGLSVVALARADGFQLFTGGERVCD